MDWVDAIQAFGQPIESSILTDDDWENAKRDNRVVSIIRDDGCTSYTGVPGTYSDRVMCRAVFASALPSEVTLVNVDLDDINWDFSKAAEEAEQATVHLLSACTTGDVAQLTSAIARGANVNHTASCDTSDSALGLATINGHFACVELLLKAKADISNATGSDLWRLAILNGQPSIATLLETHGVQPSIQETFIQAAHEGNVTAAPDLLVKGADVNASCSIRSPYHLEGMPLTVATLSAQSEMIDFLLSKGADAVVADSRGVTAWIAAAATGQNKLCSFLESIGARRDLQAALVCACHIGNVAAVSSLISAGADPTASAALGLEIVTPLEAAFQSGELGRELNDRAGDIDEEAAEAIRCELIDVLLSHGADANQRNRNGRPFLLRSVDMMKDRVIAILTKHGADANITDEDGNTALHEASEAGKEECAKRLLLGGANPNCRDKKGRVPFMVLFSGWNQPSVEIAKWLIAYGADLGATTIAGKSIKNYAKRGLRKASDEDADTEPCETILDLLNNPDAFAEYAGVMAKQPSTADEAFCRANCALRWLQDGEIAVKELVDVVRMAPEALDRVAAGLGGDEWTMRYVAALALAEIGSDASQAVPQLVERLNDDDDNVAKAAASALVSIGPDAATALLEAVGTSPLNAACRAAFALCAIDENQQATVLQTLKDRVPFNEDFLESDAAFEVAGLHDLIAAVHLESGDRESAAREYEASVRLNPDLRSGNWGPLARLKAALGDDSYHSAIARYSEGRELANEGKHEAAKAAYRASIDAAPEFPWGYNNLAWLLATCDDPRHRDGASAVTLAQRASELTLHRYHGILDTLAAAFAEAGDFTNAVKAQEKAVRVSPQHSRGEYEFNLNRYRSGLRWSHYDPEPADVDGNTNGGEDDFEDEDEA